MEQQRDPRVFEVCTILARACRAVRFYPPNHPVTTQEMTALFRTLESLLSQRQLLRLEVTETSLAFEGSTVYTTDNLQDNIAFYMYRDGIRSLVFYSGVQWNEVLALVSCLARARELDKAESDLVTVLWEQDFSNIQYEVVDPLLEAEAEADESFENLREGVRTALQDASAGGLAGAMTPDQEAVAGLELDEENESGLLTTDEVASLESALESEADMLQQFLLVLAEILASNSVEAEMSGVSNAITGVLSSYLEWGEFAALATSVGLLRDFVGTGPGEQALVERLLDPLRASERLRKATSGLDGPYHDRRSDVEWALRELGPQAHPVLLEILIDADGQTARKTVLNVLTSGPGVPLALVAPHLEDSRWYVVRNMVVLIGALGDPSAVELLERTLHHPDERVRREAVRALTSIDDHRAASLVGQAIDDPAPSVRIPAARAYASTGALDARDRIMRHVTAKDFVSRSETEVEAMLDALGAVADDRVIPMLDDLWGGRVLLRSRPLHVRLSALKALARIASPRAHESLRRASNAGDEQIRRQAARCLAGSPRQMAAV